MEAIPLSGLRDHATAGRRHYKRQGRIRAL